MDGRALLFSDAGEDLLKRFVDDIFVLAGSASLVYGVGLLNIAAAYIVGGLLAILWGVVVGMGMRDAE